MGEFSNFISTNGTMTLNRLECLRGAYFFNECNKCVEICPHNAIFFRQKKMHIDDSKCLNCGGCIGICPTSAITTTEFNVAKFVNEFQSDGKTSISCEGSFPCIAVFDRYELITIGLRSEEEVVFSLQKCHSCEHKNGVYDFFISELLIANRLLLQLNKKEIKLSTIESKAKRELFNKLKDSFKNKTPSLRLDETTKKYEIQKLKSTSLELLKFANIELNLKEFKLFGAKNINSSCDGCSLCVLFCPTGALNDFKDERKFQLFFETSKCISCGICKLSCSKNAISTPKEFFIRDLEEKKEIFSAKYGTCTDCKCGYLVTLDSAGEEVCSKCLLGREHTKDMFKLASEMS